MDIEEHGRRWSNAGLGPMFLLKLPGIRKVAVDAARPNEGGSRKLIFNYKPRSAGLAWN